MSQVDTILKKYEIGKPIFEKIFLLSSKEIKKLIEIISYNFKTVNQKDFDFKSCEVIKTIKDDEPNKIELCFYDKIYIDCFGIYFMHEHSGCEIIREFDQFFNFNNYLNNKEIV